MDLQLAGRGRPILIAISAVSAIALFAIAVSALGVRSAAAEYVTTFPPPQTQQPEPEGPVDAGVAFVPDGGAQLWHGPDRDAYFTIHEGVVLPYMHRQGDWLLVTTMCNETSWVNAADVVTQQQANNAAPGPGFDLAEAVVVLDPGHGDRDWGGVGPSGLSEKAVNLDIAERVRERMSTSQTVDWGTGAITAGDEVPAFGSVILTRDRNGPNEGDFELGLGYRSTVANAAGADAFVSIHNNTVPRFNTDIPGSEVYYAIGAEGSDRLAGLIYQELLLSFSSFSADWTGGELLGARARIDPDTGDDYYGILRRAAMPAVIVEGVYISEPEEEALLATPEFRQAYADAVYRGIVRFLTSDENGAGVNDPEVFQLDAGTVSGNGCDLPAQPSDQ
jgi:N-acetylmuramoyl-L-alanine amidase